MGHAVCVCVYVYKYIIQILKYIRLGAVKTGRLTKCFLCTNQLNCFMDYLRSVLNVINTPMSCKYILSSLVSENIVQKKLKTCFFWPYIYYTGPFFGQSSLHAFRCRHRPVGRDKHDSIILTTVLQLLHDINFLEKNSLE